MCDTKTMRGTRQTEHLRRFMKLVRLSSLSWIFAMLSLNQCLQIIRPAAINTTEWLFTVVFQWNRRACGKHSTGYDNCTSI